MRVKVSFTGLKELQQKFRKIPRRLKTEMLAATKEAGDWLLVKVQLRFIDQGPGWAALNEEYRQWKLRNGLDGRILFRIPQLFRMFRFRRNGYSGGLVGVADGSYPNIKRTLTIRQKQSFRNFRGFKLGRGGPSYAQIAQFHEEGAGRTPPRPFFEPTALAEAKAVAEFYEDALKRALNS